MVKANWHAVLVIAASVAGITVLGQILAVLIAGPQAGIGQLVLVGLATLFALVVAAGVAVGVGRHFGLSGWRIAGSYLLGLVFLWVFSLTAGVLFHAP